MPMAVQIMADSVAGGDIAKLQKMMEKGEVKSLEALPKFFDELGRLAEPFMKDYFNTIKYSKGNLAKISEDWFKRFMEAGGTRGTTNIYDSLADFSKALGTSSISAGKMFESATEWINVGILTFRDLGLWLTGRDIGIENIFETYLGKFDTSIWTVMSESLSKIVGALGDVVELLGKMYGVLSELGVLADLWATAKGIIKTTGNVAELAGAVLSPELGSVARLGMKRKAENEADRIIANEEASGKKYSTAERKTRFLELTNASLEQQNRDLEGKSGFSKWWTNVGNEFYAVDSVLKPFENPANVKAGLSPDIPVSQIINNPLVYPDQNKKIRDFLDKPPHPLNSSSWWEARRIVSQRTGKEEFDKRFESRNPLDFGFGAIKNAPDSSSLLTPMIADTLGGLFDKAALVSKDEILTIIHGINNQQSVKGTTIENISINVTIEEAMDGEQIMETIVSETSQQLAFALDRTMNDYRAVIS